MPAQDQRVDDVDRFLRDYIDSVPHLEAFLLLWNSRPKTWSVADMAEGLFVAPETAKEILEDLLRQQLITGSGSGGGYQYKSDPERDRLVASVDATYRRELIRVSTLLHGKPSAAVREFARAFRLKKDRE